MTPEITRALDRAKAEMFANPQFAFLTAIFMQLKFKFRDDIPTAAVDGIHLFFNTGFFESLPPQERVGIFMHEVMHIALNHLTRVGQRDKWIWNVAGDHVINLWLLQNGAKLPNGALADRKFNNMLTEEVYNYLVENPDEMPKDKQWDDLIEAPNGQVTQVQQQIDDILIKARTQADITNGTDSIGNMPGDIKRFFEQFEKAVLPWPKILYRFINTTCKKKYTFNKPNRRFMPEHYLPTRSGKGMDKLTFCIDVSGSIGDAEFKAFVSEVANVMKQMSPKETEVTQFDTRLVDKRIVRNLNDVKNISCHGGGGTDITEAILDYAKSDTVAMVMLTDGYFSFHGVKNPMKPVMWVVYDNPNFSPPFGKVVHFGLKDLMKNQ